MLSLIASFESDIEEKRVESQDAPDDLYAKQCADLLTSSAKSITDRISTLSEVEREGKLDDPYQEALLEKFLYTALDSPFVNLPSNRGKHDDPPVPVGDDSPWCMEISTLMEHHVNHESKYSRPRYFQLEDAIKAGHDQADLILKRACRKAIGGIVSEREGLEAKHRAIEARKSARTAEEAARRSDTTQTD